jgi:outer membrane protein OmpA-like peptidoglycan-associated protein
MRVWIATLCVCLGLAGCGTVHKFVYGQPTTFIVFFEQKSSTLTPDAVSIVKSAADTIRKQHPKTVQIAAGVAPGGNMEMSQPRFAAVRQLLIDDGVDESIIARSAIPDPKLDTGTARQRVEIRLLANGP